MSSTRSYQLNQDFKELLQLFAEYDVEYLVAGGYAVVHHTQPRYTKDLDLWIKPSPENAKRIQVVFSKFGIPLIEATVADFESEGLQYTIGVAPCAIDFLTTIPGLDFIEAYSQKSLDESLGFPVYYVGREDMMIAKATSARPLDLADLEELKLAAKINPKP